MGFQGGRATDGGTASLWFARFTVDYMQLLRSAETVGQHSGQLGNHRERLHCRMKVEFGGYAEAKESYHSVNLWWSNVDVGRATELISLVQPLWAIEPRPAYLQMELN